MTMGLVNGIERGRQKTYAVDYTPRGVVRQGLLMARTLCPQLAAIRKFVDPCAGAGVFGEQVRALWPDAPISSQAIEIREEERSNLLRHYTYVASAAFQDVEIGAIDLLATNPKFGLWNEVLRWASTRMTARGVILLYGLSNWGHSREPSERSDVFEQLRPTYQLRVMGRVRHRLGSNAKGKPYGTDSRKYSWWLWDFAQKPDPRGHRVIDLPELPPHERRFSTIPGTETEDPT